MLNATDGIIDATGSDATDGISDVNSNRVPTDPHSDGVINSEIIGGYDAEPSTERVFEYVNPGDGPVKRTRSGAIDGRSLRGRRRKSATDTAEVGTQKGVPLGSLAFGDLLYGIHGFLAQLTKTPELAIEKDESKKLGDALQGVAACYGHVVDPRVAAWLQLGMVASAVYGTRVAAIRMRMKFEAREKRLKVTSISSAPQPQPEPVSPPLPAERHG